jgi:hypothetical protein
VPGNARQAAAVRPATVAIHNHGDVARKTGKIYLGEQIGVLNSDPTRGGKS